jgi:hypothetical protein
VILQQGQVFELLETLSVPTARRCGLTAIASEVAVRGVRSGAGSHDARATLTTSGLSEDEAEGTALPSPPPAFPLRLAQPLVKGTPR